MTTAGNTAMCPTGKVALGGGGAGSSALMTSAPVLDANGRAIGWTTQQTSGTPDGLTTYVICADAVAAPPQGSITVLPDFNTFVDNTVSITVPGIGQHDFTFHVTGFTGSVSFSVLNSGNVTRNSDGTYGFCDVDGNRKADLGGNTFIVAINGAPIIASTSALNVAIPTNGVITVTIDSATPNQRQRVVGWQDKSGDGRIDLVGSGDASCSAYTGYDATTDGAIVVSGRKFYFGPEAAAGVQFSGGCAPVYRHDPQTQAFSAGATSATSLKFNYDIGDTFKVLGNPVTIDQFKNSLSAVADGTGDTIAINYAPGGASDFNICFNTGAIAPSNLAATIGDFDGGGQSDDVRLSFTTPNNFIDSYAIQRAFLGSNVVASSSNCTLGALAPSSTDAGGSPAGSAFSGVGTVTALAVVAAMFTDSNLGAGGYCYRVRTDDPVLGTPSFSSYAPANVGPPPPSLTVTPAFSANEDNTASLAVPGIGQHTYTFQATSLSGTVAITALSSANIVHNSDGTFSFIDDNGDRKADGACPTATVITAINDVPLLPPLGCVANVPIPGNGTIKVTIDSATRNQRLRLIMWQDLSHNGGIDLSNPGSPLTPTQERVFGLYDVANDGLIAVSGRKFYFGPEGGSGTQFVGNLLACDTGATPSPTFVANSAPVFRHNAANNTFSAGPTAASTNLFRYDSNDIFRINGALYTLDQFKTSLTASAIGFGDAIAINYRPDPTGISEFNITCDHGADAPDSPGANGVANPPAVGDGGSNPTATLGNFDGGTIADDVRIQFLTPDFGNVLTFQIQRADAAGPFGTSCSATDVPSTRYTTVGSVTENSGFQLTFIDFDRPGSPTGPRTFCYRVRAQDPTTGQENFSIVLPVTVGTAAADTVRPISTAASLVFSAGFGNTLDTGDRIQIVFSEQMNIAPNAVVRVTDSDCGPATNSGAAPCAGGNTNTLADIICGTNATCALDPATNTLSITMTNLPTILVPGSTPGVQFPVVITDSNAITDISDNIWDLTCGPQSSPPAGVCGSGGTPDRVIP